MATVIKCPICGNAVSGNVCNQCGWIRLVFPADVPDELQSLNSEYTETLKAINKNNSDGLKKAEVLRAALEKELYEEKRKNSQKDSTIQSLRHGIEGKTKEAEEASAKLDKRIAENQSLQSKLEAEERALEKERQAHTQSIQRAEQLQRELEKAKASLQSASNHHAQPSVISSTPTRVTNKEPKGNVVLSAGSRQYTFTIYSGENIFTAPDGIGISGDMFRIVETNGLYKIFDVCGLLRKANGKNVKNHGEEISNGLVFTINDAKIKLILPEINLDDLL